MAVVSLAQCARRGPQPGLSAHCDGSDGPRLVRESDLRFHAALSDRRPCGMRLQVHQAYTGHVAGDNQVAEVGQSLEADSRGSGLFQGFEGYVTPDEQEYSLALRNGMVVPDTNILLNLYRYRADARDDLLAVLAKLADRLWVPHQVILEFWRNREEVLRDPRDTKRSIGDIKDLREKAERSLRTWANRISLPSDRLPHLLDSLNAAFQDVVDEIDKFTDASAAESSRNTNKDPVVCALEPILHRRVGAPLSAKAYDEAVAEGLRRVEQRLPPGYMDKKKGDETAAGDYLVWEQVLVEASERQCDVVFVTGDVKEDWWREVHGERRGPRIELVDELRERTGGTSRLYMLRPTQLLDYAGAALEVTVREESVEDADRVEKFLSEPAETLPWGGWNTPAITRLLAQLEIEAQVRATAIRTAAQQGGFVSREQVYQIGDYAEDRSLRGFTRPINRLAQILREQNYLPEGAVDLLWAVYNDDSPATGWAAGFRIHPEIMPLFSQLEAGQAGPDSAS